MEKLMFRDFDEAYRLLQKAFISAELRPYEKMKALFLDERFLIYGYKRDDRIVAALIVWELEGCVYLENFAVDECMRGYGLGGFILDEIKQLYKDCVIVLEVEKPFDEMSSRRIGFYQRHGFVFNNYCYVQPSLDGLPSGVTLYLMSYNRGLNQSTFNYIKSVLFRVVYGIK